MTRRPKNKGRAGTFLPEMAAPQRGTPRRVRVERDLRDVLVAALAALSDPRIAAVSISRIELTEDLSFARIYVRDALGGDEKPLMRGLEAASGRLRAQASRELQLRRAPELRFLYDRGLEHADRVEELLREIAEDE
jgi:ribosome-binding factor A